MQSHHRIGQFGSLYANSVAPWVKAMFIVSPKFYVYYMYICVTWPTFSVNYGLRFHHDRYTAALWSNITFTFGRCQFSLLAMAPVRSEGDNKDLTDIFQKNLMTSSNGNIFRVTGLLCREFTGHRWIPRTKGSDAELCCFLWSTPE